MPVCQSRLPQSVIEKRIPLLKQNLKIKIFIGTSENALLTQIWTAEIEDLRSELEAWSKKTAK
jgi:hypothetical protein